MNINRNKKNTCHTCIANHFVRHILHCMILASAVTVAGCNKNAPPTQENSPASQSNTTTASNMAANIAVKGDEKLPPNHPPLPAAPHANNMNEAQNQQIAAQHPQSSVKKKLVVIVPDFVKGKWSSVTLSVSTGKTKQEIKLPIGNKVLLENKQQLHLLHYLPAYTSDFQSVTSSSDKQDNPAVQIALSVDGKVASEGWIFQNYPEFNSFHDKEVKIQLISAERALKK